MFIEWRDDRYVLDHTLVGSDVARCLGGLQRAISADDNAQRAQALEDAGHAYKGDLADGAQYEWVETAREEIRRRVVDGLVQAPEIRLSRDEPDRALSALEEALRADPHFEDLYRRIMRIHRDADRPDAIRRTYRLLERRLAELDVDPAAETTALREAGSGCLTKLPKNSSGEETTADGEDGFAPLLATLDVRRKFEALHDQLVFGGEPGRNRQGNGLLDELTARSVEPASKPEAQEFRVSDEVAADLMGGRKRGLIGRWETYPQVGVREATVSGLNAPDGDAPANEVGNFLLGRQGRALLKGVASAGPEVGPWTL